MRIVKLEGDALAAFLRILGSNPEMIHTVRLHVHDSPDGGIQVKVNQGVWTTPLGNMEQGG